MSVTSNARLLFSRAQIDAALDTMAVGINQHFHGQQPLVLTVLQGGVVFAGHLLPRLSFELELDSVHASRYAGALSGSDEITWLSRPRTSLAGRAVLLLDDIYDQGFTLAAIANWCRREGAASVMSAVLVRKRHERPVSDYRADFTALEVDDVYVFGFGMDRNHVGRNANGIFEHLG